ncbi:ABC transporter permease subunit [Heyndrickxia sporothermodurans]|uniref:ABC transporter permease n=1 Tax=Heyndrickxia sporothermodurans TaxID=46224 RepID=UPI002DB68888|nr:ABC transporter permease subunit [Heyndrickxia sporothermodurans]MEB6550679.1 ABC transporter permease subunit [Heyndrickxia sporothermodurans]MED3655724.1 ABC transporter permease subunit [Heyndrickxia sporothermodurans]MED3780566.1 ABC transporter permease subunit [Heyndrickxia sporothermodurans]
MHEKKTWNPYLIISVIMVFFLFAISIVGPLFAPHKLTDSITIYQYGEKNMAFPPLAPFTYKEYPLGTDKWGYDLLTLLIYGAKYTVFISISIALLKIALGLGIGLFTGIMKKRLHIWESFEHSLSYIPSFLIIYFVLWPISFNPTIKPISLIVLFIIVSTIIGFPSVAASIREKTIQVYRLPFIEAAITTGSSKWKIIKRHIIPHLIEDIVILFVLEIVTAITVMGQLALFNIFIGGTKLETSPTLYHSITKEWAGLVGQARDHLWGNQFVLFIPLVCLLFAIVSFQLLAVGLKKHYNRRYQTSQWI